MKNGLSENTVRTACSILVFSPLVVLRSNGHQAHNRMHTHVTLCHEDKIQTRSVLSKSMECEFGCPAIMYEQWTRKLLACPPRLTHICTHLPFCQGLRHAALCQFIALGLPFRFFSSDCVPHPLSSHLSFLHHTIARRQSAHEGAICNWVQACSCPCAHQDEQVCSSRHGHSYRYG